MPETLIHGMSSKFTFGAQSKPILTGLNATKTYKRVEFGQSRLAHDSKLSSGSPSGAVDNYDKSKTHLPPVLKQASILKGTMFDRGSNFDRAVTLERGPTIYD